MAQALVAGTTMGTAVGVVVTAGVDVAVGLGVVFVVVTMVGTAVVKGARVVVCTGVVTDAVSDCEVVGVIFIAGSDTDGVWQPKPFTSKIMTIANANNDFLVLIRVSSSLSYNRKHSIGLLLIQGCC